MQQKNEEIPPILDSSINSENPFLGDLYLDIFPEWYDVE
jgi:hypothetical protein